MERSMVMQKAGVEVAVAMNMIIKEYDLSYFEIFSILTDVMKSWIKYGLKDEMVERGTKKEEDQIKADEEGMLDWVEEHVEESYKVEQMGKPTHILIWLGDRDRQIRTEGINLRSCIISARKGVGRLVG